MTSLENTFAACLGVMQNAANLADRDMVKHRIVVNLEENEYLARQKMMEKSERFFAWLGHKAICDLFGQKEQSASRLVADCSDGTVNIVRTTQ